MFPRFTSSPPAPLAFAATMAVSSRSPCARPTRVFANGYNEQRKQNGAMARSTTSPHQRIPRQKLIPELDAKRADIVDAQTRSRMMASVAQKNTRPELEVRKILRDLGIHYRIANRDLPGSPDIANRRGKWAIFVNGCFWHGHKNCPKTKSTTKYQVPKTRAGFWSAKLLANRSRDAARCRELRQMGYRVLILWECALLDARGVVSRLGTFCEGRS